MSTPEQAEPGGRQQSEEELVQSIYNYAAQELMNGVPAEKVEQRLIEQGLPAEAASTVVQNLLDARSTAYKQAGRRNMLIGGLVAVIGLVVTIWSYSAAAGAGGGKYVVAWGAIVFGAIQFFRGVSQASQQ